MALLGWLVVCGPAHQLSRLSRHSQWPRRFLRGVGWIVGARVLTKGEPMVRGTLIIANHVSWLDIPVMAGATGCAFVAKDELQAHPLMRWLCEQNDTVFVDRSDKRGIALQTADMLAALHRQRPLVLFPEGTVGNGGRLLPFRPALLSAFTPAPPGVGVRPIAVDYAAAAHEFGWPHGESGRQNFLRLLGRRGTVTVTLHLLPQLAPTSDRKQLARAAQESVATTLAPSGVAPAAV